MALHAPGQEAVQQHQARQSYLRLANIASRKFETWLRDAIKTYETTVLQVLADREIVVVPRASGL